MDSNGDDFFLLACNFNTFYHLATAIAKLSMFYMINTLNEKDDLAPLLFHLFALKR